MRRTALLIVLVLALAAAVKAPFEASLAADRPALARSAGVNIKMREQIGQGLSLALLGGFRALVADLLWIAAHGAWEERRWFTMRQDFEAVTMLQPQAMFFWDLASWHLAWNASHAASTDPAEPRLAVRLRNQRLWIQAGRELLERGIANNPDRFELYEKLGWMLKQKIEDPCGAADAALAAVKRCQSWQRDYLQRLAGYWLEECAREKNPARLREAYDYWRDLWRREYSQRPREHWDTIDKNLSKRIQKLEADLAVPESERLFPKPQPSATIPAKS
ncbi:MAG: hypothetical protein HZA91_13725 [Verrucomicrobia bacterium]|nr:hypothetical protein [Verrucomicrobiota bacterium]